MLISLLMKKLLFLILVLTNLSMQITSCDSYPGYIKTPSNFISEVKASKNIYSLDSSKAIISLVQDLKIRHGFFNNSSYFDSTELIIDSILYSPGLDKLVVLLIVKNPTYRQLMPDRRSFWYFDATYYLGKREGDSLKLFFIGPSFTNAVNKKDLSNIIRNECFNKFAMLDSNNNQINFNFNDKRFWDSEKWLELISN